MVSNSFSNRLGSIHPTDYSLRQCIPSLSHYWALTKAAYAHSGYDSPDSVRGSGPFGGPETKEGAVGLKQKSEEKKKGKKKKRKKRKKRKKKQQDETI